MKQQQQRLLLLFEMKTTTAPKRNAASDGAYYFVKRNDVFPSCLFRVSKTKIKDFDLSTRGRIPRPFVSVPFAERRLSKFQSEFLHHCFSFLGFGESLCTPILASLLSIKIAAPFLFHSPRGERIPKMPCSACA